MGTLFLCTNFWVIGYGVIGYPQLRNAVKHLNYSGISPRPWRMISGSPVVQSIIVVGMICP